MKLAASQYAMTLFEDFDAFAENLIDHCREAKDAGAELLLLPEYAAMVMTGLLAPDIRSDLHASIAGLQQFLPRWLELSEEIARNLGIVLCPGSAPVKDPDGHYRNRSWLFGPDGMIGHQDKIMMTRFEKEQWGISSGQGLTAFDTPLGRLGILICYDNEFPMLARTLAERDADLILAPSCTDAEAGYYRVRIGAQARALENQIAVLVSPTAGRAPWSPAVDENFGKSALYVPSDYGMPPSGVIGESESVFTEESRWSFFDIDLETVRRLRREGQVFTRRDWPDQFGEH
ncbi:carbon-nitrogen hydrolase family protein [Rhizobium sp. PAMB 3174]